MAKLADSWTRGTPGRLALALAGSLSLSAAAPAAEVQVRVLDAVRGAVLTDAAVCLGTAADPAQFGAVRTGRTGLARFDEVPATPLVLTVSRDQYRGYRVHHGARRFDVVLEVALHSGGLGPSCDAPFTRVSVQQGRLAINDFSLNAGRLVTRRRDVLVAARVEGAPTHYRISEHQDFSDTDWRPYALPGQFRLSRPRGSKTVYFQVRRYRDADGSSMQSLSEVVRAEVALQ